MEAFVNFADRTASQTNTAPELFAYIAKYRALWEASSTVLTSATQTIGGQLANIDADHLTRMVRPNGLQKVGDARYSSALRTNYAFREDRLKGFSVGGGARWRGDTLVGYSSTLQPLKVKGYTLIDATLGYRTKARLFGPKVADIWQIGLRPSCGTVWRRSSPGRGTLRFTRAAPHSGEFGSAISLPCRLSRKGGRREGDDSQARETPPPFREEAVVRR